MNHPSRHTARGLAEALVAGPWAEADLLARGRRALSRSFRGLPRLVGRILAEFEPGSRPRARVLTAFLLADARFRLACGDPITARNGRRPGGAAGRSASPTAPLTLAVANPLPPAMAPAAGPPASWPVPEILTPEGLAARLGRTPEELAGYADLQGRHLRSGPGPLRNYDYRWVPRRAGPPRLVEAPRPRLKALQRQLLAEVLNLIPPHEAAHGFRPGRSVLTFVTPHVGRHVVLKLDLKDFFPSIGSARVAALLRTAGYPEPVALLLAALCTNRVPADAWSAASAPAAGPDSWRLRQFFRRPHLPQGAPTSPALANLCAFRLDARLSGLARSVGAAYTRYADDLAFSGDRAFARGLPRFRTHVHAIAIEEGFALNTRKTRTLRRGVRQRVAGVVLNDRPNVPRDAYDALKATLHNCLAHGPIDQNQTHHPDFRAHLSGRVAHVAGLNPARGEKLRALLDRVAW